MYSSTLFRKNELTKLPLLVYNKLNYCIIYQYVFGHVIVKFL